MDSSDKSYCCITTVFEKQNILKSSSRRVSSRDSASPEGVLWSNNTTPWFMKSYSKTVTNNHVNVRGGIKDVCFHHYLSHPDATVRETWRVERYVTLLFSSYRGSVFCNSSCNPADTNIRDQKPSGVTTKERRCARLTSLIMCLRDSSSLIPRDSVRLLSEPTFSRLPECIFPRVKIF